MNRGISWKYVNNAFENSPLWKVLEKLQSTKSFVLLEPGNASQSRAGQIQNPLKEQEGKNLDRHLLLLSSWFSCSSVTLLIGTLFPPPREHRVRSIILNYFTGLNVWLQYDPSVNNIYPNAGNTYSTGPGIVRIG